MTRNDHRRTCIAFGVLVVVVSAVGWELYTDYRVDRFVEDLHLVTFSTSMIGSPRAETERAAAERARDIGIDLFDVYQAHLERGVRFSLAWMLISDEAPQYYDFAKANVTSIPWPEVRIWVIRRNDESLSDAYRQRLLDLVLASSTSEAKLAAGRWYRQRGRLAESEDAFFEAMTRGLFWDALDAADELIDSERYHPAAIWHLLAVVRDPRPFPPRAATSLARYYGVEKELQPLVDLCVENPRDEKQQAALVERLTLVIENDLGARSNAAAR